VRQEHKTESLEEAPMSIEIIGFSMSIHLKITVPETNLDLSFDRNKNTILKRLLGDANLKPEQATLNYLTS